MNSWESSRLYLTLGTLFVVGLLLIVLGIWLDSAWLLWSGFFVALPVVGVVILGVLIYSWFKRRKRVSH